MAKIFPFAEFLESCTELRRLAGTLDVPISAAKYCYLDAVDILICAAVITQVTKCTDSSRNEEFDAHQAAVNS